MKSDNTPLVSILMPYYKTDAFLLEAVKSVRDQTYENWELIVVDDASPGVPAESALSGTDCSKVKIIRHEKNQGVSGARNTAAQQAQGHLFVPLDCDDLLAPRYLEETVRALNEGDADAAYTDVQLFGTRNSIERPDPNIVSILCGEYPFNTFLYSRRLFETVGGYDPHTEVLSPSR